MGLSKWIASEFAPGHGDPADLNARARVGLLEGWVSVVVNTVLAALKGWLGLLTGSVALLADAAHTFADSLTSVVVIFGFRIAARPADPEHPFGHGRAESVAGVVVAVLLGVAAFEMGRAGLDRVLGPRPVVARLWVIAVVAATLVVKLALGKFSYDLGRIIDSPALIADAWHHLSDVLATALVLVAFAGSRWNVPWLDGAMGLGVALMIGWAAVESMRGATGPLIGQPAPDETYREIARLARSREGVLGVHDILVHRYGNVSVVSLHVEVPHTQSAMRLHEMSEGIEGEIAERLHAHAIVHVDPVNPEHPQYRRVRKVLEQAASDEQACESFHDLRLVGGDERFKIVFDISTRHGVSRSEINECRMRMCSRLESEFPGVQVVIDVEPSYMHDAPAPDD